MIVLRHGLRTYKPRLTIDVCIQIEQLYGSVTKPLEGRMPSLSDTVFIIALSLQQYMLDEDTLYEIIDEIENPLQIVFKLYEEAGLINTQQDKQDPVEAKETPNNEEINNEPTEQQTFEQMCDDMLKNILQINLMPIHQFYASTLKEITLQVESYNKFKSNEMEQEAFFSWQTANLIGMSVARLLSKDAKYPKLEEAYPFTKQSLEQQQSKEQSKDNGELTAEEQLVSARLTEWAHAMKRKQQKQKAKEQKEQEQSKQENRVTE